MKQSVAAAAAPTEPEDNPRAKRTNELIPKVNLSLPEIQEEFSRLLDHNDRLSPADVVEAARDEMSPLHRYFIWDNDLAAERYRLMQAGVLIRRIKVTIIRREHTTRRIRIDTVRRFHSPISHRALPGKTQEGGSYLPADKIARDKILRKNLINTVLIELEAVQKRYKEVSELQEVWKAIEKALRERPAE